MKKTTKIIASSILAASLLLSPVKSFARELSCAVEFFLYSIPIDNAENEEEKRMKSRKLFRLMQNSTQEKRCCLWNIMVGMENTSGLSGCKGSGNSCRNILINTMIASGSTNNVEEEKVIEKETIKLFKTSNKEKRCCLYNGILDLSNANEYKARCLNPASPPKAMTLFINNMIK